MQVGRYVKKDSPIDIVGIYNDYIDHKNEQNRKERYENKEHWYHASGAGSCSRKLYFESVQMEKSKSDINPRSSRLLRLGTILHDDFGEALTMYNTMYNTMYKKEIESNKEKEKNINFHIEKEITIDSLNVRGFYDIVAEDGKVYLYDLKSCASYSWTMKFGRKKQFDPSIYYELQLGTYGYAVEKEFGRIDGMYLLYYNKDNSRMKYVEIPLSFISRAYLFWKNINDEHKQGLPMFKTGVSPVQSWNCSYCQFLDVCNPPNKQEIKRK